MEVRRRDANRAHCNAMLRAKESFLQNLDAEEVDSGWFGDRFHLCSFILDANFAGQGLDKMLLGWGTGKAAKMDKFITVWLNSNMATGSAPEPVQECLQAMDFVVWKKGGVKAMCEDVGVYYTIMVKVPPGRMLAWSSS